MCKRYGYRLGYCCLLRGQVLRNHLTYVRTLGRYCFRKSFSFGFFASSQVQDVLGTGSGSGIVEARRRRGWIPRNPSGLAANKRDSSNLQKYKCIRFVCSRGCFSVFVFHVHVVI